MVFAFAFLVSSLVQMFLKIFHLFYLFEKQTESSSGSFSYCPEAENSIQDSHVVADHSTTGEFLVSPWMYITRKLGM